MRKIAAAVFVMSLSAVPMCVAQVAQVGAAPAAEAPQPRIYVTDSNSWQVSGGGGGTAGGFGGSSSA